MYRSIQIDWAPRSQKEYNIINASRLEAGKLWSDLVERHFRIRRLHWKWPSKARWFNWGKQRYPNLNSQSVQQIVADFLEAVDSAKKLRKTHPELKSKFPWRKSKYHDVIYTNQGARIRNGYLLLPHGKAGTLIVKIPKKMKLPGRLMEAQLKFGRILLTFEVSEVLLPTSPTIGVDLGVNTLIAATDGYKAVLINGRRLKSIVQLRSKILAKLDSKSSSLVKGSRRSKRLREAKSKFLKKSANRVRDILHKATRLIANEFPNSKIYVGKPFNGAAKKVGKVQAQQISSHCGGKLIQQLDYKCAGAIEINEAYSSQTCPVCGCLQKCKRVYKCVQCGLTAPRDVIGATNILSIGVNSRMELNQKVPVQIKYLRI